MGCYFLVYLYVSSPWRLLLSLLRVTRVDVLRLGPLVPFPRVESVSGSVRVRPFGLLTFSVLDVQSGETWTGLCAL